MYRVVLAVLMEFIVVIILAVFGVMTRNIRLEEPNIVKPGSREESKAGRV